MNIAYIYYTIKYITVHWHQQMTLIAFEGI